MLVSDWNGPGGWAAEAILERYHAIAKRLGQKELRDMTPVVREEGNTRWVYSSMDKVIAGIKAGDLACIEIGVEFIESWHKQPFGRDLHLYTARALRQTELSPDHCHRLRKRILDMLVAGLVPGEYREYAKLLRRIGLGNAWRKARGEVDESNEYVMRYVRYFEKFGELR